MFCNYCGASIPDGAMYCSQCGKQSASAIAASSGKSKVTAGVLGIILGGFGIHRFYLGYVGLGIVQLLVTLITFGLGAIWGFIEGILILTGNINTDSQGRRLIG